jgi:hypothetical protein
MVRVCSMRPIRWNFGNGVAHELVTAKVELVDEGQPDIQLQSDHNVYPMMEDF